MNSLISKIREHDKINYIFSTKCRISSIHPINKANNTNSNL